MLCCAEASRRLWTRRVFCWFLFLLRFGFDARLFLTVLPMMAGGALEYRGRLRSVSPVNVGPQGVGRGDLSQDQVAVFARLPLG